MNYLISKGFSLSSLWTINIEYSAEVKAFIYFTFYIAKMFNFIKFS